MDRESAKKLYLHAKSGEFSEALELIENHKLVKESALNVIISISNACSFKTEICELDKMELLVTKMVTYVDSVDESHLIVYLQSIFHIITLLCKKECFEGLAKMNAVINASFLDGQILRNTKKAEYSYSAIIMQISRAINCLAVAKNTSHNKNLLEIFRIILEGQNKLGGPKELLTLAQMCLNQAHHLEVTNDQMLTFYSTLLEILASNFGKVEKYTDTVQLLLIPIFSNILTDIINSKNFEFASMVLDIIETRVLFNFKQPEYVKSHLMFRAVLALLPINKDHMQKTIENVSSLLNEFKTSYKKLFHNIICFLEEPLQALLSFYRNEGSALWNQMPEIVVLHILKLLMEEIISQSMRTHKKCSCGCEISKNYSGILKIGCSVAALLKSYVKENKHHGKHFFSQVVKWLYFFYEITKKLKDGGCQKWSSYYNDLSCHTYNTSVVLYIAGNIAHKQIDLCFLKNSLELEGTQPKIRPVESNTFIFSILCDIEFKNENWIDAMGLAALHCLLYIENSNSVFQNYWIRSKIKVKDDSYIQQQTLLSALYSQSQQLSQIFDIKSLLTTQKKIELLIFELNRYKAIWRSKVSMMTSFQHLIEIADIPTISEVILTIYGDGEPLIHDNMSSLFQNVISNIENYLGRNSSDPKVRLALAVLYYYHFKSAFKETADKNLKEMETTMQVLESAKKYEKLEPVPKDANDECDIASAYTNLQISKVMENLKTLNTCEQHISAVLNCIFESDILKSISKLLTKIGCEYRLHCFSIKSLHAFYMSMKCAQEVSDNEAHLFALSFLIESADVKKNFVKELFDRGEQLVKVLEKNNENERYDRILAIYYICKSKAFLNEDPKQSYESWQKGKAFCTANKEKDEFQALRAELYILLYQLTKNCSFIQGEHSRQPMTLKLHAAYDIVIEMVEKNILSSYDLCVVFDTVYNLAKVYSLMGLPRDLRAYSKHSVLFAQKIVLPVRCVSFLLLLAHSDLATCKFDHCKLKLDDINDIFCLSQSRSVMVPMDETGVDDESKNLKNDIERCADLVQELVLDLPQHTRQYSLASPPLVVEGFKYPQFVYHRKACTCLMCLSPEFKKHILEKYHVNALLSMYEKENKLAEEFVAGALALHKMLNHSYNDYLSKTSKLIPSDLVFNYDNILLEPYGNILHDYSYHLSRKGLKSEALQTNTELIKVLKAHKKKYVYLYHNALLQRLSYIVPNPQEKQSSGLKKLSVSPTDETSLLYKTPAGKSNLVTLMVNGIPIYSPPRRRKIKKCNLFDVTNDVNDSVKKSFRSKLSTKTDEESNFAIPKTESKKNTISTFSSTPFFGIAETSKIQIFTDDQSSVKTYSRKGVKTDVEFNVDSKHVPVISGNIRTRRQLLSQEINESSAQNTRMKNNLTEELLKNKLTIPKRMTRSNSSNSGNSSMIPCSPERELDATKSAILFAKLKSSIKKSQVKTDKAKNATASFEVKKNLMSEFEECETSSSTLSNATIKSTGAIRKSTRNRVL